ncbi:MAG: flippase [Patescibacteria group bacterium]|jgi:O-antigen/teichoic acid export membrane protein
MFKRLLFDTMFALSANTIFKVLNAIIVIVLANYLGPDKYGIYSTAIAFIGIFLVFSDMGLRMLLIQEGSKDIKKAPVYFGNAIIFQSILTVLVIPILFITSKLFGYSHITVILILVLGPALFLIEQSRVSWAVLRLKNINNSVSISEVLQGFASLGAIFFITKLSDTPTNQTLFYIAISQLVINFVYFIVLFIYASKAVFKPEFALKALKGMLKKSYIFALSELFFTVYFQVDQIVISIIKNAQDVGFYSAPFKVIIFFLFIPRILVRISRPFMYKLFYGGMDKYKRINIFFHRYYSAIGIPLGILTILLAQPIILFLFKEKYSASIPVLKVFGWFIMFYFISVASSQSLTTLLKQKTLTKIQATTVILNLILDIIFVCYFGFVGAAYATLIVQIIASCLFIYFDAKYMQEKIINIIKPLFSIIAAGIGMAIFTYLLRNTVEFILLGIMSCFVYILFLYIFRFFNEYDIKLYQQIIKKKHN